MPPKKTQKKIVKEQEVEEVKNTKTSAPQKQLKVEKSTSSSKNEVGSHSDELGDGKFGNKEIRLATWNVNGIRASQKKEDFDNYLKKTNPDVLCLNETKIDDTNFKKENIAATIPKEYKQYWNFSVAQKGYAGTAIFSKVAPIQVIYDIGTTQHDQEGRTTTLEFEKFFIVACYVPNSGQKLERLSYRCDKWDVDFQKFLEDLRKKKPTILCGDLNVAHEKIDVKNPNPKIAGYTPEERKSFDAFLKNKNWIDTFRNLYPKEEKYSFWSYRTGGRAKNVGWRLDYFLINNEAIKAVKNSLIRNDVQGSDHCPLELELLLNKL